MTIGSKEQFDLDGFYFQVSIDEWKRIIGDALHYHFGYFRGSEDLETGLRQTVKNFTLTLLRAHAFWMWAVAGGDPVTC